jgi:hypothetical protein
MTLEDEVYGATKHRAAWARWQCKGTLVRARRRYIDERAPDRIGAIRELLSTEARGYLDDRLLPTQWYSFATLAEIDLSIVRVMMKGDVAAMRGFGSEIAMYDVGGGLYSSLLRLIGGRLSLKAYSAAYTLYFRPGGLPVVAPGVVELQGMVAPAYMCMYGFTGYMERLLSLAGVTDAKVAHTCVHEGAVACRWVVT